MGPQPLPSEATAVNPPACLHAPSPLLGREGAGGFSTFAPAYGTPFHEQLRSCLMSDLPVFPLPITLFRSNRGPE